MQARRVKKNEFGYCSPSNVSGSFYPITSAISLKDLKNGVSIEHMTVMTSRTQAGSAIKEGKIELIHARRLL